VLTDQEVSDLVTAIEAVYTVMASCPDIEKIQPILKLKDELVLSANNG
jgi:hypothetical protein